MFQSCDELLDFVYVSHPVQTASSGNDLESGAVAGVPHHVRMSTHLIQHLRGYVRYGGMDLDNQKE